MKSPRTAEKGIQKKPGNWIRCGWMLVLLTLFAGCVHVPVSSDIVVDDRLEATPPLEPGDVVVVYGENAAPPEQNAAVTYFTAGCQGAFHGNTLGELAKTILKVNPQPGRFAVRFAKKLQKEECAGPSAEGAGSVPALSDLSQDKFSAGRLRYAVHVKEKFDASVHVPLYVSPFGVASCSNKTVLEARVWDLPAQKSLGSYTVSAEGQFTVTAYILHLVIFPDTQKDAMEKLAREIVTKLAGLKPLESKDD